MEYQYLTRKQIRSIRKKISEEINNVKDILKTYKISAQFTLIGSGARNMITFNSKDEVIDFDYNLKIFKWENKNSSNLIKLSKKEKQSLKNIITDAVNKVFKFRFNVNCAKDSTSVITTKKFTLEKKYMHVDLAIICEDNENKTYRLIHKKTGNTNNDEYKFEQIKNIDNKYKGKISWLKNNNKWNKVREEYLILKDTYKNCNDNKKSISIYSEAISNVYNQLNNQN